MRKTVETIGWVVVLLVLVTSLFVAFVGLPAVVLMVTTPEQALWVAIAACTAGFILLLGNHREEGLNGNIPNYGKKGGLR